MKDWLQNRAACIQYRNLYSCYSQGYVCTHFCQPAIGSPIVKDFPAESPYLLRSGRITSLRGFLSPTTGNMSLSLSLDEITIKRYRWEQNSSQSFPASRMIPSIPSRSRDVIDFTVSSSRHRLSTATATELLKDCLSLMLSLDVSTVSLIAFRNAFAFS